jgi:hypothetical protein
LDICARLRSRTVLHRAWATVRASGLCSESEATKQEILRFDAHWLTSLEKIRAQLQHDTFSFDGEKGITPPKGKGKTGVRPLVIAPVANRIVRRAILEVLQGYGDPSEGRRFWPGVPAIKQVMAVPTSIGGIKNRGVSHGLALIQQAVMAGKSDFIRSDIQNFFTRIPKAEIYKFVRDAVDEERFSHLFERALTSNLINQRELEERQLFKLFPDDDTGVPQGSALSALAGNIALQKFDHEMNTRGITCIRYIDDFILIGKTAAKVRAAYDAAQNMLKKMGMDVYCINDTAAQKSRKVDDGNLYDGTDFLGYRISGLSRQPCTAAQNGFLRKLDALVDTASRDMRAAADKKRSSRQLTYHQAMANLHDIVWGWSQSFRYTTARHVFEQLDRDINLRIETLRKEARKLGASGNMQTNRRIRGVHLLSDTPRYLLPLPAEAAQGK